jgi:hypothetical protein
VVLHDSICFFVAFFRTDFVRHGLANSRLSRASRIASDSFFLGTFYTDPD